ncbi:MAG: PIF1 family DEAD/DEAH box helicase [Candidatus Pacebacteria bacterium]|nr:PIF1 family DEAD/DEAH box helicase [Candidatus Paceibacterota bacterium]
MTQEEALTILKTGSNIFLTGEPGSGKSHTVNQYVAYLKARGIEPSITASTGIAATHIRGMTIHAWSGIGIAQYLSEEDLDRIATKEHVVKRIRSAQVLIIDEVSMLAATTLDMVDAVCREVRQSPEAFGGLQVVLVGDFFQLPPITRGAQAPQARQDSFYSDEPQSIFAYAASSWARLKPIVCYLDEQHRQDDALFLEILTAIRTNTVTEVHRTTLATRIVDGEADGIPKLYSHNADVDRINATELGKIKAPQQRYQMTAYGREVLIEHLKRGCLSPETLDLKVGASVMFTKNNAQGGFVNGTLGTVVAFEEGTHYPIVETVSGKHIVAEPLEWTVEDNGRALATITQVPLRLAWAMTVHKSQGMSMDAAVIDLSQAFEYGQGYVALSRVRTMAGLYVRGLNARALEVHPEILTVDAEFRSVSDEAVTQFVALSEKEIATLHTNFIKALGGKEPASVHAVSVPEEKTKKTHTKIREEYANAYTPWSAEDDDALRAGYEAGTTQAKLSREFGRKPGAIRARLIKLGLIDSE